MTIKTTLIEDGKRIRIAFAYDPATVAAVKAIPGAKYDPTTRSWNIARQYAKHLEILNGVKAEADDAYANLIADYRRRIKEAAAGKVSVHIDIAKRLANVFPVGNIFLGAVSHVTMARSVKKPDDRFSHYVVPCGTAAELDLLVEGIAQAVSNHQAEIDRRRQEAEDHRTALRLEIERRFAEAVARTRAGNAAGTGRIGTFPDEAHK